MPFSQQISYFDYSHPNFGDKKARAQLDFTGVYPRVTMIQSSGAVAAEAVFQPGDNGSWVNRQHCNELGTVLAVNGAGFEVTVNHNSVIVKQGGVQVFPAP